MTDRMLGTTPNYWIGVVTNVNDPLQSGRVQVRVFGVHDNETLIPDEDLPWAAVLSAPTSASIGRMGTAPVGLVVGSRVFGFWLDRDQQYPLVLGSLGRAGTIEPRSTIEGVPRIRLEDGSIPSSARGFPNNPYTVLFPQRIGIQDIDAGLANIERVAETAGVALTEAVRPLLRFAELPTIAQGDPNSRDVIELLIQFDPLGELSPLRCLELALPRIRITIDIFGTAERIVRILLDAFYNLLFDLIELLGIQDLLDALRALLIGIAFLEDFFRLLMSGDLCAIPDALRRLDAGLQAFAYAYFKLESAYRKGARTLRDFQTAITYNKLETRSRIEEAFRPVRVELSVPPGYVQEYYPYEHDPYPGYIRWIDPTGERPPIFTRRDGQPNFRSVEEHVTYDLTNALRTDLFRHFQNRSITSAILNQILVQASPLASTSFLRRAAGISISNPIVIAAAIAPIILSVLTSRALPRIQISNLPRRSEVSSHINETTTRIALLRQRQQMYSRALVFTTVET